MYQIKNFCNVYPILKNKSLLLFGVSGAGKSYLMSQYFNSLLIDGFNVFVVNFSGLYKDYPIYLNSDYSHIFNSSLKPLISLPDNINSFCLHARCGFSDSEEFFKSMSYEVSKVVPILIKHVDQNSFLQSTGKIDDQFIYDPVDAKCEYRPVSISPPEGIDAEKWSKINFKSI